MAGRPINPNKPTGLGVGVETRQSNMHPSQRYKNNKEAEFRKKILGSLPSIAESTEEIVVDPFRSEGFDAFMQEKINILGLKNKAEEERLAKEEEIKKQIAEAKQKAEEEAAFLDSPKGRLQTLWADADKRDAILGGIADSMTEVKFGQDAYQSRFHDTQKNIRQNLRVAEATKLARQKAQLDMYKVAAETSKLANPAQYLTTAQRDAMAIVTASGEFKPGSPEWNQEYSRQLQQIVVKDLTSAKASAIQPLYTFAQVLLTSEDAQEKLTGEAMMRAIESIAGYLSGTNTGGGKSQRAEIVVEEETTT